MVRAPKSVVAVVRAHAERLMAESPFCGLLSPEQWQRELDALELMLARLVMDLLLADNTGRPLMRIEGFEPIAENPVFTVDIPAGRSATGYRVSGRDNNGNAISAAIEK